MSFLLERDPIITPTAPRSTSPSVSPLPSTAYNPWGNAVRSRSLKHFEPGVMVLASWAAYLGSLIVHALAPVVVGGLIIGCLLLSGWDWADIWGKPKVKTPDLVFVLTPPDAKPVPPKNPKTRYIAEKASRAGGQHDPTRPVNADPVTPPLTQPVTPAVQQTPQAPASPSMALKSQDALVPTLVTPPPQDKPSSQGVTAPVSQTPASPAAASASNPSVGDINRPNGVDARQAPDFGPYMRELQTRIKQAWQPPRGNESKRVVVLFRVTRKGALEKVSLANPSGEPTADEAALKAIETVFPFRPLPETYRDPSIDIEFTFDYNVFGDKQRLRRRLEALEG